MDTILHSLIVVFIVLYILLIPVITLVVPPIILIWPAKKSADGTRGKKPIKKRYAKLWKILENFGLGLPTS